MRVMWMGMWWGHRWEKLVLRLAGMRWCINCEQESQTAWYEAELEAEVAEI